MSNPLNYISITKHQNYLQYHLCIPPSTHLASTPISQTSFYIFSLPITSLLIEYNISEQVTLSENFILMMKESLNEIEEIIININVSEDNGSNLEDFFTLLKSLEHQKNVKRISINIFGRIENQFLVYLISQAHTDLINSISIVLNKWLLEFETLETLSIDFYLPNEKLFFPNLKKLEFIAEDIYNNQNMSIDSFLSKFKNLLALKIICKGCFSSSDKLSLLNEGLKNNCPFLIQFCLETAQDSIEILDKKMIRKLFEFTSIIEKKRFLVYFHCPLMNLLYYNVATLVFSNEFENKMKMMEMGVRRRQQKKSIVHACLLIRSKRIFKRKEIESDLLKVIFGL